MRCILSKVGGTKGGMLSCRVGVSAGSGGRVAERVAPRRHGAGAGAEPGAGHQPAEGARAGVPARGAPLHGGPAGGRRALRGGARALRPDGRGLHAAGRPRHVHRRERLRAPPRRTPGAWPAPAACLLPRPSIALQPCRLPPPCICRTLQQRDVHRHCLLGACSFVANSELEPLGSGGVAVGRGYGGGAGAGG